VVVVKTERSGVEWADKEDSVSREDRSVPYFTRLIKRH
jgi:hypothetical protein